MPEQGPWPTITLFQRSAPKTSYILFVGTPVGKALRNLKTSKAFLDGLKSLECERASGRVKLPIPYIPEKDELQEAVETAASIKLTLLTKVNLWVAVWSRETKR